MKIVRDKKPRWRVEGPKALTGVLFNSVEEAEHEAKVFAAMQLLWDAKLENNTTRSLYEVATIVVDHLGWQPPAVALIEDKSGAPKPASKRRRKAKEARK